MVTSNYQLTIRIVHRLLVELWVTYEHVLLETALVKVGLVAAVKRVIYMRYLPLESTGKGAAADTIRVDLQVLLEV